MNLIGISLLVITLSFLGLVFTDEVEDLNEAVQWGNAEKVRELIDQGVDVNVAPMDLYPALFYAAGLGYIDIVRILFDNGVDVNHILADGSTLGYGAFIEAVGGWLFRNHSITAR